MTDPDTTPLRKAGERRDFGADIIAKTPQDHYILNTGAGLYGNRQYADLALLLKKNILR